TWYGAAQRINIAMSNTKKARAGNRRLRSRVEGSAARFLSHPLFDSSLEPLFWPSQRVGEASAWWSHVPFAHWLIDATAPQLFIELGVYTGVSYAAFCEAILHSKLSSRAYGVDTWRGDPHAGEYGDEIYEALRNFHDERYGGFSQLLRCTF